MPLIALPNELLLLIASYLAVRDLSHLLQSSRAFWYLLTPRLHDIGASETYTSSETTLYWAARNGQASLTISLLSRGANPSQTCVPDNRTALHWAAASGSARTVKALLKHDRGLLNAPDRNGEGAIFLAARGGHAHVVRILAECDARLENSRGQMLLNEALTARLPEVARALVVCRVDVKRYDQFGVLPLHCAAKAGDEEMVRMLLDAGAAADDLQHGTGSTALHWAVEGGHLAAVKVLVGARARVDVKDSRNGATVLHLAARKGNLRVIQVLLGAGAKINTGDVRSGATALHLAAEKEDLGVIGVLLGAGADVDMRDSQNQATALHWAVFRGNDKAAAALLRRGADPNKRCCDGNTPLHLALLGESEQHRAVVKLLLGCNEPDLNALNDAGDTPLRWPAYRGFHGSVELMLRDGGADMFVRDYDGRTVLDYAEDSLDLDMIKTLLRYGTRGKRQAGSVNWRAFWKVVPRLVREPWDQRKRERRGMTKWPDIRAVRIPSRPTIFIPEYLEGG